MHDSTRDHLGEEREKGKNHKGRGVWQSSKKVVSNRRAVS